MTKHLHQMLRERDQRRSEEEAARVAAAATGGGSGSDDTTRGGGGGGGGDQSGGGSGGDDRPARRSLMGGSDEPLLATLRRPVVLASLFFTFAVGLFVGSRNGGVAEAKGGDGAAVLDETPSDAPAANAEELLRLGAEQSGGSTGLSADLTNPVNRYTIQVASYNNKASAQAVAEEHVDFLDGQGLRVVGPLLVGRGEHLVVLVEAAPDKESLERLCEQIRALPDSRNSGARFPGAYVREIDRLIER
jgi:hypothetical protein